VKIVLFFIRSSSYQENGLTQGITTRHGMWKASRHEVDSSGWVQLSLRPFSTKPE
jgi:hypothetical protein